MRKFIQLSILVVAAVLFSTCSINDFGDLNRNPNATTVPVTSALLTNALSGVGGWVFGMNEGLYAQYFSESQYTDNSLYAVLTIDFTGNYSGAMYDLQNIIDNNTNENTKNEVAVNGSNNNQIAVARILKVYHFIHQTDRWGDVPYTEALKGAAQPKYDKQADIYKDFFKELKESIAQFDGGLPAKGDILFNGNIAKWKKWANSMRLILAMRLSKVDEAQGKAEFAAAFSDAAGYLSSAADDVTLAYPGGNFRNPWYGLYDGRKDYAISDVVANTLSDLSDPRLRAFGEPNDKGEVVPIPYGLTRDNVITYTNQHADWSKVLNPAFRAENSPIVILSAGEVLLTIAEAIQRGWVSGDKNKFYADGIHASWARWDVFDQEAFDGYIASAKVVLEAGKELERIGTQKWLAIFPDGRSGWTEWRRTGVPDLKPTPAATNNSKKIPRRFIYPSQEYNLNGTNLAAAVSGLSGGDTPDGRVWWDK